MPSSAGAASEVISTNILDTVGSDRATDLDSIQSIIDDYPYDTDFSHYDIMLETPATIPRANTAEMIQIDWKFGPEAPSSVHQTTQTGAQESSDTEKVKPSGNFRCFPSVVYETTSPSPGKLEGDETYQTFFPVMTYRLNPKSKDFAIYNDSSVPVQSRALAYDQKINDPMSGFFLEKIVQRYQKETGQEYEQWCFARLTTDEPNMTSFKLPDYFGAIPHYKNGREEDLYLPWPEVKRMKDAHIAQDTYTPRYTS